MVFERPCDWWSLSPKERDRINEEEERRRTAYTRSLKRHRHWRCGGCKFTLAAVVNQYGHIQRHIAVDVDVVKCAGEFRYANPVDPTLKIIPPTVPVHETNEGRGPGCDRCCGQGEVYYVDFEPMYVMAAPCPACWPEYYADMNNDPDE